MARDRLEEALGRLGRRWRAGISRAMTAPRPAPASQSGQAAQISLNPGCAYGVRYAQAMEDLQRDLAEVKARLNGLLFLLAGAVALELVIRLVR